MLLALALTPQRHARATQPATPRPAIASSGDLGGAQRYLAHVSCDKPIYRIGEVAPLLREVGGPFVELREPSVLRRTRSGGF